MGLVLLFKAHYSREHQASHSTRKHLRSQSVLQAFTSFLSLDTVKSPRWHWERSCSSLASAQVRDWGWHSTSCTHTPCTQLTLFLPQLWLRQWAISPIHTVSLAENTGTANQEHLQEHCSFPLHLQFPPEAKHWHGAHQRLKHTHHCTGWGSKHYLFLAGDLTPSVFWQWEQNRGQITQSLALKTKTEWHKRGLEKPGQGCFLSFFSLLSKAQN